MLNLFRKSMNVIGSIQATLFLAFVAFPVAVYAQVAEKNPTTLVQDILQAVQGSNWKLAASGLIILVVYIARHYGSRFVPWLLTRLGTATLTASTAIGLGVANYIAVGKRPDVQLFVDAMVIAVTAFLPFLPELPKPVELPSKTP